jgi:hypothetical protein
MEYIFDILYGVSGICFATFGVAFIFVAIYLALRGKNER